MGLLAKILQIGGVALIAYMLVAYSLAKRSVQRERDAEADAMNEEATAAVRAAMGS